MNGVRAALGDDIHDPAHRLAELGLVPAGLDLDFLEEVERHGVAERPVDNRVGTQRAESLIRDVHAVDHVLVIETAASGNRRVLPSDGSGVAHARRHVGDIADPPQSRHGAHEVAVDHAAACRAPRIDYRGPPAR